MSFENFISKKQKIDDGVISIFATDVVETDGNCVEFTGKFAGTDYNKPLHNAIKERFANANQATSRKKSTQAQIIKRIREITIELFPYHVITDWNLEKDGEKYPYNPEECVELLRAIDELDNYEVVALSEHFTAPGNFRKEILTEEAAKKKAN